MPKATLEQVVAEARSLTPEEQQQLKSLLDSWAPGMIDKETQAKERLLMHQLLEEGIISHIPQRDAADADYKRHPPIEMQGEPISETIIRERR